MNSKPLKTSINKVPEELYTQSLELLKSLIQTPSYSGEETVTADLIYSFLIEKNITVYRKKNNVWAYNRHFSAKKPTLLLNSHHDTVKANAGYTKNPFNAEITDGKLYGLGSNDAGGCLVTLIATFRYFYNRSDLPFNICLAATAEEENSGENGIHLILPELYPIDFAFVAEPTLMQMATAERGNIVIDCIARGKAGHAARDEGDNAIYKAWNDIRWFQDYRFSKKSLSLGPVKMSVTQINAGLQHNIIPADCSFTVDIRLNNRYSIEDVLDVIRQHVSSEIQVRPGAMLPSCINSQHPVVKTGLSLGLATYSSPTSSDQGWLTIPSLKMGPGDSARSHMADEYIYTEEIKNGIAGYISFIGSLDRIHEENDVHAYCLLNHPVSL